MLCLTSPDDMGDTRGRAPDGDDWRAPMSRLWGDLERAALRDAGKLIGGSWEKAIDLVAEPVPPTPDGMVEAPGDEEAGRLDPIEHIVVVMLENRSFDHMLGYLSLPAELGGKDRKDVDGLRGIEQDFNMLGSDRYPIHRLAAEKFKDETEDPDHSGASVDEQLSDGGGGFVKNFARISSERAAKLDEAAPDPGLVMGYYDGSQLPVYDHLSEAYCVVDRWFSSVPGATWPNRLYAMTGQSAGSRDDISPPIYGLPSFVRHLDDHDVSWRWYSFDPATLRLADPEYRLERHEHFAFVDQRSLSLQEQAVGKVLEEGPSFLDDAANDHLPSVSWIDPRFKDLKVLGPNSNDDHPPSDLAAGQDLVLRIFHALRTSDAWARTLLVITYDEHGGFYDHVPPPAAEDENPDFRRLGVRVPAILVSPYCEASSTSSKMLGPDFHFDHTSIIKTILTRFCNKNGQIPAMTKRVQAANHLGHLLSSTRRDEPPGHEAVAQTMAKTQQHWLDARYGDPVGAGGSPERLTDLQAGYYAAVRLLRHAGLPAGRS
jgi:phospholipase C